VAQQQAINWEEVRSGIRKCLRKLDLFEFREDLEQEAMLRAFVFSTKSEFRYEGAFSTWGYSIARNIAMDHFRKEKERRKVFSAHNSGTDCCDDDLAHRPEEAVELNTPLHSAILNEVDAIYYSVVDVVPVRWARNWVEHDLHGQTYKAMSRKYGGPIGTFKSSVSRTRAILKPKITELYVTLGTDTTKMVLRNAMEAVDGWLQRNHSGTS
jgi:RNA polymerase sigma factor (sigma-70 family)